jgi:hypothetical protein
MKDAEFGKAADEYYKATREYWDAVIDAWDEIWAKQRAVTLKANSDQSGAFAGLFELAEDFATGKLTREAAKPAIRAALAAQGAN